MAATPAVNAAYQPLNEHDAVPAFYHRPAAASAQAGRGQFVTVSLSTGYAALNDGTAPNEASAGTADIAVLSDTSTVAGDALIRLSQRWQRGVPASTASGDGFADTDFGKPFFIADENTPGKKSNLAGDNRSLGGLCFGLSEDGNPILWDGPVAWLLARATLIADATVGASLQVSDADGDFAEVATVREKAHGVVTAVEFTGDAIAADNTDFVTITVAKRDGAGGAAVTVATYDSRAANNGAVTAWVPKAFTLSAVAGALNLLETDIITVTGVKGGAGKSVTGNIRLVQKVI